MGMLTIGAWVSNEIEDSVTRNSAISAALYMESFIAPLSQELARDELLSSESRAQLLDLLREPSVAERIVSVKIWKKGGLVAFSTNPDLMGERFEPTENLKQAWTGLLVASFDDLDHQEAASERAKDIPLLEIYNPIHSRRTGEVIAVAEFYQNAQELQDDLFSARLTSWAIVGLVTAVTFALLFGIVRQGSNTIARQNRELQGRLEEITRFSEQNKALRQRIQAASLRASALNERLLRRTSAELHDGPAQALALASLRLDSLANSAKQGAGEDEFGVIRQSLDDALEGIRLICRGLTLPELEGRSLADSVQLAVSAHERRTGTSVTLTMDSAAASARGIGQSTLICIYRFLQEGLMNAYRHAEGHGQRVKVRLGGSEIEAIVEDDGPGFEASSLNLTAGLGLSGLRERIESTGGEFRIEAAPGHGTRLVMRLPTEA